MTTEMQTETASLDNGLLMGGFVIGLMVGIVTALFSGTRLRPRLSESTEMLRDKLEAIKPVDPLTQSLEEGKAAARRRRTELGIQR